MPVFRTAASRGTASSFARLRLLLCLLTLTPAALLEAQTIEDTAMMPRGDLCTGLVYMNDRWDRYWEGTLKRQNGNIGTITTQSVSWVANYGVTDRLNVIAMLPYVWTEASQGVLHGASGFQDVTVAAKYHMLTTPFTRTGSFKAIAVASASTPATDYVADFLPLSIGLGSSRVAGRLTLSFEAKRGWFVNGSGAYTWRGNVGLDRSSYFTDGRLFLSDEVSMPDVFDYMVSAGYKGRRLHVPVSFTQQYTRGGGDIRRQDMPFVSNRMNHSRVDVTAMYWPDRPRNLGVKLGAAYTVAGRNVGQATTLTAGLLYTLHF
jgi:hypothetical protein